MEIVDLPWDVVAIYFVFPKPQTYNNHSVALKLKKKTKPYDILLNFKFSQSTVFGGIIVGKHNKK